MKTQLWLFRIGIIFFWSFFVFSCSSFLEETIAYIFPPKDYSERLIDYSEELSKKALLEQEKGNHPKAESLCLQALDALDQANAGPEHSAFIFHNLAGLYKELGDDQKADSVYRKVLEVWKKYPGEQSPEYAAALNNLNLLHLKMDRHQKPEPLQR